MTNSSLTILLSFLMNFWTSSDQVSLESSRYQEWGIQFRILNWELNNLLDLLNLLSKNISYVESGTFSTFMRDTRGSTLLGRILCSM